MAVASFTGANKASFFDLTIQLPNVAQSTKSDFRAAVAASSKATKMYPYIRKGKTCYRATPPRPMNAFILYRRELHAKLQEMHPTMTMPDISKAVSKLWRGESEKVRNAYCQKAKEMRERHAEMYPGFQYRSYGRRRRSTCDKQSESQTNSQILQESNRQPKTSDDMQFANKPEVKHAEIYPPVHSVVRPARDETVSSVVGQLQSAQEIANDYKLFCQKYQSTVLLAMTTSSLQNSLNELKLQQPATPGDIIAENGQTYTYQSSDAVNLGLNYPFLPSVELTSSVPKTRSDLVPRASTTDMTLDPFFQGCEPLFVDYEIEQILNIS